MIRLVGLFAEASWSKIFMAGLVVLGLYWFFFFDDGRNLQTDFESSRQELETTQKKLKETRVAIDDAERFRRDVMETVDQFSRVNELMPEKTSLLELTTTVTDMATKSGAKLLKTEPRPGMDKTDFYETIRIGFSLEGTFSQLVYFLAYISEIKKFMTFDHIDVAMADQNSDVETPRLIMNGVLTGYRYSRLVKDEKKDAAGAKPGESK